jgi:predicted NAD/FAD-dependent oxidoreductase
MPAFGKLIVMKPTCLIIGAGISALLAAHTLQQHNIQVTLLDKSRGVGGRMATRRFGGARFDHGAQFFTVRTPPFAEWVEKWLKAGVATEWTRGFDKTDGYPRYRGNAGISDIPKHLAQNLDIRLNEKVTSVDAVLNENAGIWQVTTENGNTYTAHSLIMTPPVEQSLALLANVHLPPATSQQLQQITYDPCFALLALLDRPSQIPAPGAVQLNREPIRWLADNQQKGISPLPAVTIHAAAGFTQTHYDSDRTQVANMLIAAAQTWLGEAQILEWQLQRWRYSQPATLHPDRCLVANTPLPLIFAGDAFGEPRVEGAALSGLAAGEAMVSALYP